jgi:hypothetical protein
VGGKDTGIVQAEKLDILKKKETDEQRMTLVIRKACISNEERSGRDFTYLYRMRGHKG